ncbi:uncharacterized protein LOC136712555 [Amia ocellicauda]|uniref:uncharacterized protein LOC136712555 n=1 Tax=Amia ocellicauda TaxID=2972642 RepID=UPI003464817B
MADDVERTSSDLQRSDEAVNTEQDEQPSSSGSGPVRLSKDHCDFLLDSIDAQLSQMQAQTPSLRASGNARNSVKSLTETSRQEHKDKSSSCARQDGGDHSDGRMVEEGGMTRKEQYKWRLEQLLGSEQDDPHGYESDLNTAESICTEDFAAKFKEGMVDPQLVSNGELGGDYSGEEYSPESVLSREGTVLPVETCLGKQKL